VILVGSYQLLPYLPSLEPGKLSTVSIPLVQSKHSGQERYMAFLDIKAAYDRVDRNFLWKKLLEQKKMPLDVVTNLHKLLGNFVSRMLVL